MMRIGAIIAAVLTAAFFVVLAPAGAEAQSEMTFRIQSEHENKVQVKFFSQDRADYEWPGGGKAYNLDDSEVHAIKLKCLGGETICYGGWVTGNSKLYWGAGADGKRSCKNCCYVCDGGQTPIISLE